MTGRGSRWRITTVALVLMTAEWMAVSAVLTRSLLVDAQAGVTHAQKLVRAGDVSGALAEGDAVQQRTRAAHDLTSGPLWAAAGVLPWVDSARTLVASVDGIAHDALPPLTRAAQVLQGAHLRKSDGSIDLSALNSAGADIREAQSHLSALKISIQGLNAGPVDSARGQLLTVVAKLEKDLSSAALATRIGPEMLGADGPHRYILVFQNTAEARGTGGLMGAWAEISVDQGRLEMIRSGGDGDFHPPVNPVKVPQDFLNRWGIFGSDRLWGNVNESPHFPWVAETISELWQIKFGEQVDGVLSIDTQTAAAMVAVTGPIKLSDGTTVNSKDLTSYVQQDLYRKYPTRADRLERQAILNDLQTQLFNRLKSTGDAGALLSALADVEGKGHLKMWSRHPAEQKELESTLLAGALPTTPGPFAGVIVNNAAGNKTDSFLERDVHWTEPRCSQVSSDGTRESTLTLKLRNTITEKYLNPYLAGVNGAQVPGVPLGRNLSYLSFYATVGATDPTVTVDGVASEGIIESERQHPVTSLYIQTDPGQSHTITVRWREPAAGAVQPMLVQPLVIPAVVHLDVASCS